MSGRDRHRPRVMTAEDADDATGNPIPNTETYAVSTVSSPRKERSNIGKSRRERPRTDSTSPVTNAQTDSDSTVHPRRDERSKGKDREREKDDRQKDKKRTTFALRPAAKQSRSSPAVQTSSSHRRSEEPQYYGNHPQVTPAAPRPRHGSKRPSKLLWPGRIRRRLAASAVDVGVLRSSDTVQHHSRNISAQPMVGPEQRRCRSLPGPTGTVSIPTERLLPGNTLSTSTPRPPGQIRHEPAS